MTDGDNEMAIMMFVCVATGGCAPIVMCVCCVYRYGVSGIPVALHAVAPVLLWYILALPPPAATTGSHSTLFDTLPNALH